ncbi:MAG: REP-associated tyrosine transposase [Terriglobia bacterium]
MAIPKRHTATPGTYFITSRTWESRALFVKTTACDIFVRSLLLYRDQGAYRLHAFVIMPDHFHVLLTPGNETTLERSVQYIKGGSARRFGEQFGSRFPMWQRGYSDHRIRDAEDFQDHVRYIDYNPVKRGLASASAEYVWSSACGRFKLDGSKWCMKL